MRFFVPAALAVAVAGCANSSVMPISKDTFQVTTSASGVCGATGAKQVALRQAAVETIRQGYDSFVIVDDDYRNNVQIVGYTPVVAKTTEVTKTAATGKSATAQHAAVRGNHSVERTKTVERSKEKSVSHSTTTYSGGQPIIQETHDQELTVKMFKDGDPEGAEAVSARATLGPKWQEIVASPSSSCLSG